MHLSWSALGSCPVTSLQSLTTGLDHLGQAQAGSANATTGAEDRLRLAIFGY